MGFLLGRLFRISGQRTDSDERLIENLGCADLVERSSDLM